MTKTEEEARAKKEYIACSAIWVQDGKVRRPRSYNGVRTGFVAYGLRHGDCLGIISELYGFDPDNGGYPKVYHTYTKIQGFLTSKGRFVDREEGARIAFEAGQTSELLDTLYSEDIY